VLDIGVQELLVIMVLALIVFGPDKLPELGRRLGRAMREFRRASDEFRSTIETNLHLNEDPVLPPSSPTKPWTHAGSESAVGTEAGIDGGPVVEPTPEGALAGASTESGEKGAADVSLVGGEPMEPFWTRRGSRLLHRQSCGWRRRVPEAERVGLKTATDGWDMGLLPCPVCEPREAEPTS
jgi:sec-independent protein translocase protein TatA